MDAALDELRMLSISETTMRTARQALHELARKGRHRLPPFDVILGAVAEENGVALLHYDRHFDVLAEILSFDSVWLAPAGTID
jgi:predicted nucleic acid-binding protein